MNRTGRAVGIAAIAVIAGVFACTDLGPSAGSPKALAINTGLLTIQVGQTLQANAAVRNALGTPIDGVDISWSSSNPAVATISNTGLVTAVAPGTSDVTASALGLSASAQLTIVPPSPTAAALTVTAQPSSSVASGSAFATQPALQLRDSAGNAVASAGVIITASIAPDAGTLGGSTIVSTSASGLATFTSLSITGPVGTRTLNFSAAGFPAVVSAAIDVTSGPATSLSLTTQPSASAQSAIALAQQPVIQLRDASGNAVGQAGITVTASVATGTLGGTAVAMTDANGVATFTDLSITGAPGGRTMSFAANTLSGATSIPIAITAGAPTVSALALTTQPSSSAQTGVALAQQPVVQIRDGNGNAVSQAGVVVTAAIASGGGTLGGTLAVATNAIGVASFTDLSITGTAGSRTLTFTSGSLSSVTSSAVAITIPPPPPAALTVVTQPSTSAASGATLTRQPAIQLSDANGNAVSQAGVSVTAAVATGGGTLGGTATATTNALGLATFTNLSVTGTVGARTLTFTSGSLAAATSSSIDITAGPPTALAITTQPSATALLGVAFAQQPAIQLRDANGNAVSQVGTSVTAAIAAGGGTLGGTATVTTNASGVATFTNLSITGTAGVRTLTFTSGSFTAATSSLIDVTAAPSLTFTTQPSATAQAGVVFAQQPAIQLRDGNGNALSQPGATVTATIAGGGGTLGGTTTAITNAAGLATFTDLKLSGIIGTRTLSFSAPTFGTVTSGNIGLTAGPASALSILTQPSASPTTNVVFPAQPVLRLKDASANDVSQAGVDITARLASGSGTLNGTKLATTNASGIAAFSGLSITGTGTFTLGFDATGLIGSPSAVSTALTMTLPPALATTQAVPNVTTTQNAAMTPVTPVTASGGTTPYSFAVSPALPSGVSMSTTTGQITGTPTATLATATFTVTVTDGASATSSKTFTLNVNAPAAPGALYPNRPASFTLTSELNFSQAIPSAPRDQDRPIAGTDWFTIYHLDALTGTPNWVQTSDAGAPQSAPGVWQGHWAAGSYGGGVIGQGGGHGIGNLFTYGPGYTFLTTGTNRLYLSMRLYFDLDPTQWHPISNKFVNLGGDHSQILMQLKEGSDKWRHAEELGAGGAFTSFFVDNGLDDVGEDHIPGLVANPPVPTKQWVQIELLIDIPNHVYKIWQDGVLTTNATPNFASTKINTVGIYAFRGGGGETLSADMFWKYDHFFIAW